MTVGRSCVHSNVLDERGGHLVDPDGFPEFLFKCVVLSAEDVPGHSVPQMFTHSSEGDILVFCCFLTRMPRVLTVLPMYN